LQLGVNEFPKAAKLSIESTTLRANAFFQDFSVAAILEAVKNLFVPISDKE